MTLGGNLRIDVPVDTLLQLPAAAVLRGLETDLDVYHLRHGLRPPLGIYNTSIQAVTNRLSRVLELDLANWPEADPRSPDRSREEELLERQDALLDALAEHVEDLSNLLLTFFPSPAEGWRHAAVQAFKRELDPYRTHVGKIDNFIKHKQGRLRLLVVRDADGSTPGYYAEAPFELADGRHGLGPSEMIHGGNTAYSFNRDLRLHGAMLLLASQAAAQAITSIVPGAQPQPPEPARPQHPDKLMEAFVSLSSLPGVVFIDEVAKPWPSVTAAAPTSSRAGSVVVELPGRSQPRTPRSPVRLEASMRGDGVTRSFRIPYRDQAWAESR